MKVNLQLFAAIIAVTAITNPAFGYIDPGSGSAIASAVIGFFVAIGLAVKTYWYKLKALFGGGAEKTVAEPEADTERSDN